MWSLVLITKTGSVEVGKLADLVIWKPASFGTKPSMVIKSGMIAYAMIVRLSRPPSL